MAFEDFTKEVMDRLVIRLGEDLEEIPCGT